ncbi:MAG: FlgD immunoglobulin-like domain containing protein, partial [Barnesiella sp.]
MKKTLRTWLSLMGVALLATSMKVYAEGETLTEVWKQTDIPGHADARHATAFGGKIYVQDKGAKKIFVYDGTQKTEIASAGGTSITVDDAGNLVYAKKFPVSTAASQAICPAGGTSSQDLTLTLNPDGRIDFMGRMTGDIMSAEGGTMYFLPPTATKVQCVEIKNGVQTGTTETGTITSANNGQTYAIASSYDGKIVYQVRTDKAIYQFDEAKTTATAFKTPNINSSAGFAIFKLYGVTYVVYPTGTNYKDGFSIANQETGEVVAVHEEEASSVASSNATANWLYADVENDNTASIYQFSPGNFVAKYTFTVPAIVEPAIADRNIFAYGLTATEEGENYTLAYNLNTDATNVTINIKNADGTVVKTIEGTTAAGANSVSVAKADIQGDNLSWEVVAKGTAITEMARITPQTMDYA